MLYNNFIIIFIGILLVIVSLYFIIKQNSYEEEEMYYKTSQLLNNSEVDTRNNNQQELVFNQLNEVLNEMEELKLKLQRLEELQVPYNNPELATTAIHEEVKPFNHALNYQLFLNKNEDIIKLHLEGLSPEVIARKLNKSFREVEMIIKLIK